MRQQLPNQLTVLRLILAAVFFVILNQYRYPVGPSAALWWAIACFVLASLTDIADGYLARRWQVESAFGRVMDPFCDKVLNIGALIYLSGPRFVNPEAVQAHSYFNMASGVYPWMVVLVLAREMLVTLIRDELESAGVRFGAKLSGKLKTLLQSIGIPVLLGIVALSPEAPGHEWMIWLRDGIAYSLVVATVISGLPYVLGGLKQMRNKVKPPAPVA